MIIKRLLLVCAVALMVAGCAVDLSDEVRPTATEIEQQDGFGELASAMAATRAMAVQGAVYHEATDSWIAPQVDPYTLANFQAAADKLVTTNKTFSAAKRLKPTHYALRIYPKTEEEQWRVEMMEDVNVAYIPFDHIQLTQEEAAKVSRTRASAPVFPEKSPYTVTYENYESTDGGSTEPITLQLPILYAVWPVDKPLPTDLEHVVDYEVFLPDFKASTQETRALLGEAVAQAQGITPLRNPMYVNISGNVSTYDGTAGVERNVPLAHLKVSFISGGLTSETQTDASGNFTLPVLMHGQTTLDPPVGFYKVHLTFTYQDPQGRWSIRANSASVPYSVTQQVNVSGNSPYTTEIVLQSSRHQENEIHRAVNYYYNVQTDITRYPHFSGEPMVIRAHSFVLSGIKGMFTTPNFIDIYNPGDNQSTVIGTTLHEIGHFAQYHGAPSTWRPRTNGFLVESFACYAGWCLGEKYYKSVGWIKPGGNSTITGQDEQDWNKFTSIPSNGVNMGWYSPLFIDLTDDFNQSSLHFNRPNDEIEGVPTSFIWSLIKNHTSWESCRVSLQNYVLQTAGEHCTAAEFDSWIESFDIWHANFD